MTKSDEKKLELVMSGYGKKYKNISELECLIMRKESQISVLESKGFDCGKKRGYILDLIDKRARMNEDLEIDSKIISDLRKSGQTSFVLES